MNKARTQAGLLVAALIFVAIGVGVVFGAQRLIGDAAWVSHSNEVIGRIDEVEARLRDAEAAQRGYLITGDVAYLADYRNVRAGLPAVYEGLIDAVDDNPAQVRRAQALQTSVRKRMVQMAYTLDRYREGGLPAAQASIGSDVIGVSGAIRRQALEMSEAERALLVQRGASTQISANLLRALALLGIPLGLAVIAVVYAVLLREIRQRARAEDATADANEQLKAGVDQLQRSSTDLRALSHYGSMLQSCVEPAEALQLTMRMLSTLLPGTSGTVYHMRHSQDHAEATASWGAHASGHADMLAADACWALRRGQPHIVSGPDDVRCMHSGAPGQETAIACIPLIAQGVQLGLLYLSDDDAAFMSRIDIIEAVGEQLSMALSNLYLQERLRLQSIREPLTGLFNRRYLEESALRELARCARRQLPLSLMMLDVDHFKAFNDVHGHVGGDALLAGFGKLLLDHSRSEDIACRYGGEEFTLILPEADAQVAWKRAESIRVAVEAMRVHHLGVELPKVTVSIGIANFPNDGTTPAILLRAADEALYRAKRNGRNRIEQAATRVQA